GTGRRHGTGEAGAGGSRGVAWAGEEEVARLADPAAGGGAIVAARGGGDDRAPRTVTRGGYRREGAGPAAGDPFDAHRVRGVRRAARESNALAEWHRHRRQRIER